MTPILGIDAVDIDRFERWNRYTDKTLLRIFSSQEIDYAKSQPIKTAERLASRFAAKEAFYKALCASLENFDKPFLVVCKHVSIADRSHGAPRLIVNWQALELSAKVIQVSLTHTSHTAFAVVMILS